MQNTRELFWYLRSRTWEMYVLKGFVCDRRVAVCEVTGMLGLVCCACVVGRTVEAALYTILVFGGAGCTLQGVMRKRCLWP